MEALLFLLYIPIFIIYSIGEALVSGEILGTLVAVIMILLICMGIGGSK